MATALPTISELGEYLLTENNKAEANTPNAESSPESQSAPEKEPRAKKNRRGKTPKTTEKKGITPSSPTVYLLPDEKRLLKKLEAHILLETGKSVTDHQLIMDAIREYAKRHHSNFRDIAS